MHTLLPSRRLCTTGLNISFLFALFALIVAIAALAGCSSTPQQQYDTDFTLWNYAVKPGVYAYTRANPVTPAEGSLITTNLQAGDKNLAEALIWLNANPALIDTPGVRIPSLSTQRVVISVLSTLTPVNGVVVVKPGGGVQP